MVKLPFIDKEAIARLAASLGAESVRRAASGTKLKLAKAARVDRIGGLKVDIFADEHPPPHFRVSYQGASANFSIDDCSRMTPGLERFYSKIRDWHADNRARLIAFWNETRPTDCPVGEFKEEARGSEGMQPAGGADSNAEKAAFLAQFAELHDESILSEAEKTYVAVHRAGSFPSGKLGWRIDGSLNLYAVDEFGPMCAVIRLPTDPIALKKHQDDQIAFIEKVRKAKEI